ncbi:transposase [bacterium]|nr:transposase [bacterium]
MSTYAAGFKARMVQRMAGPESISATALAKEVGVSQNTLSRWLRQASEAPPTVAPMTKKKRQSRSKGSVRTAQDKLRLVLEASALSEEELGAFLRREGVHEAQLEAWRSTAMEAAEGALKAPHGKRSENTAERRTIRDLERELTRKDKALAEVSALLILKKKIREIWGDEADSTGTRSGT